MKEVVTLEDLALFQKANRRMEQAQEIQRFAYDHLNEVYTFKQGDTFDPTTGEITRFVPPAAAEPAPLPEPESPE